MEHQYHDREDGLAHCKVCNGGEGSLPSECPGRRMTDDEEADVYAGKRDFRQGQWVRKSTALRGYFRSVTQWQAEEFVVQVTAGRFRSRSEAESFGNQPMRLVLADGILRLVDAAGQPIPAVSFSGAVKDYLLDDDVEVSKLKPASAGKLMTDHSDYEPVNITMPFSTAQSRSPGLRLRHPSRRVTRLVRARTCDVVSMNEMLRMTAFYALFAGSPEARPWTER